MRAGIPDLDVRLHTLTTYINLSELARRLEIKDFAEVQVLLLDADGDIVWRAEGEPDAAKAASLAAALEAAGGMPA